MLGDSDGHRAYEDYAVRHVMGGLDEAQSGAFRSHLLDCAECRARVGELRSIASDLAEVERSDRRDRAAQRVETQKIKTQARETPPTPAHPPGPPRGLRILMITAMLFIVVLSVWNFVLRGQNEGLRVVGEALAASAETINFGDPWDVDVLAANHTGVARVLDERMAVMVRGTDDDAVYRIGMFDGDGEQLFDEPLVSADGQLRWYGGPLPESTDRVEVTLTRSGGDTIVLRATGSMTTD
jgi:hypothetical protein